MDNTLKDVGMGVQRLMKIVSKTELLDYIESHRKERGLSIYKAVKNSDEVNAVSWGRFGSGKREPTYDHLFAMAKAVGLRINLSARPN